MSITNKVSLVIRQQFVTDNEFKRITITIDISENDWRTPFFQHLLRVDVSWTQFSHRNLDDGTSDGASGSSGSSPCRTCTSGGSPPCPDLCRQEIDIQAFYSSPPAFC